MINTLRLLYPTASFGPIPKLCDCVLEQDENGIKIAFWNAAKLGPQPTLEYLEKKAVELAPQIAALEFAAARRAGYEAAWPRHEESEALLEAAAGRPEKLAALLKKRAAVRAALPKLEEIGQ